MDTVLEQQGLEANAAAQRKDSAALAQALHGMAKQIAAGDPAAAQGLAALMQQLQQHPDPRCTGLMVFASALAQRVSGDMAQTANLYLRRFEVPQIELFNLLGRCMPLVHQATRLANETIAAAMQGQDHPTLIDVGIGTGRQITVLLDELFAQGRLPKALTVIGIEPGTAALAQAERLLRERAATLGLSLQFHGIAACSEALGAADWQTLRSLCPSRPIINGAFALHHIADDEQGRDQRQRVLRELLALDPLSLVLIEPDVDHLQPQLLPRFEACFAHFGAVFALLDQLPLTQAERDALKVGFFGREIHDVLGTAEALRTERHETVGAWLKRLDAVGFVPQRPQQAPVQPEVIQVQAHPSHLSLNVGSQPVLALLVAVPRR